MNLQAKKITQPNDNREINTMSNGLPWDLETMQIVWNKGREIPGCDPDELRWDICGRVMCRRYFNMPNCETGWVIDHVIPVIKGGGDELSNLQPLNWKTNMIKGDNMVWRCNYYDD